MVERGAPTIAELSEPEYRRVDVADLLFDPENPRLGGAAKGKDQRHIQKYLEDAPHYALSLTGSLVENGFLPYDPLIVRQQGDKFVVIEGNRRLAAALSILNDQQGKYAQPARDRLKRIPALIFSAGVGPIDTDDELRYLGVKHLFGFRDWPPASKAMFLDKRIKTKKDLEQVLREVNIKPPEAARYLIPYRLAKAAKQAFRSVNTDDFWSLAESFGRREIKAYIQLDVDRRAMRIKSFDLGKVRHLVRFLYGRRKLITDTRQLSLLGKVLSSQEGASQLERGASLEEASLYMDPKGETIGRLLSQVERLLERLHKLSPGRDDSTKILGVIEPFIKKLRRKKLRR